MAEFVTVMSEFMRLCDSFDLCEKCPVNQEGFSCDCDHQGYSKTGAAELEHIIMTWAADHPELVYPTWGEWLEQQGICFSSLTHRNHVGGVIIPEVFNYQIEGKTAFMCGNKVNEPIPDDIAQKLGIEPKVGA